MNWSIERKTRVTFILVILLVILIGFFAYQYTLTIISANQIVQHRRQIIDELTGTLAAVQDVQTGQLTYMLLNDDSYLQQYGSANEDIAQHLANLKSLTADEPIQQDRLVELNVLITRWLPLIEQAIHLQEGGDLETAHTLVTSGQAGSSIGLIRSTLGTMTRDEQDALAEDRSTQANQRSLSTLIPFSIVTVITIALLTIGYMVIHRDLARRRRLEQQLLDERTLLRTVIDTVPDYIYLKDAQLHFILANQAMTQLMGAASPEDVIGKSDADFFPSALVPQYIADEQAILQSGQALVNREEQTTSANDEPKVVLTTKIPVRNSNGDITQIVGISHDITIRKRSEEKIELLNQNLRQQTAQLENANKELEAFSYSVSHDLRAPLRAIDGFSRILVEEYGSTLPTEAERYLQKVRANAQRMGELIDDLLQFSRLSRQAVNKQMVDPAAMVRQLLEGDLRPDIENRQIEFQIGELPAYPADAMLLRQVMINLLSNAIKFTSKREKACIEIGSQPNNDTPIYYVRDNGAGFDAQYASKLFGVFQRLHNTEEYSGTGVGLAIVQRIVNRHGGKVWAEGAVDKGATFYFTLGGENDDTNG